jgi:hypothetical protein
MLAPWLEYQLRPVSLPVGWLWIASILFDYCLKQKYCISSSLDIVLTLGSNYWPYQSSLMSWERQLFGVGEIFIASLGMLPSFHQKVLRIFLDQFFLYDFVVMFHQQQWDLRLHLYYHLHTVDKHVSTSKCQRRHTQVRSKRKKMKAELPPGKMYVIYNL